MKNKERPKSSSTQHKPEKTIELNIIVKPFAKETKFIKIDETGDLHISLHAKPKDGEANNELIKYLSKLFKIPKSRIEIIEGLASRSKRVKMPVNDFVEKFLEYAESSVN